MTRSSDLDSHVNDVCLHRSNAGGGARVCSESREWVRLALCTPSVNLYEMKIWDHTDDSISLSEEPAGRWAVPTTGLGTGMTSEQSIRSYEF